MPDTPNDPRKLELDAAALKALAHPLRVRMLDLLQLRGQVSVTSLARELGESTGATSYHLRQLARHGFVEQCPADSAVESTAGASGGRTAGGKQRWWRMAVDEVHISGYEMLENADTREAFSFLMREDVASRTRKLANWHATATGWPKEWQRASSDLEGRLELTPAQTRALADELKAVLTRYRALPKGQGARLVDIQYAVFPADTGDRP